MAKVFLDTNYFIGLANRTPETETSILDDASCFISVLSCHVLFYVNKLRVPDEAMNDFINDFNLINLNSTILSKSQSGPTEDLEDNIQLHSAAKENCDVFLTFDKKLLKMKFFGKTHIVSSL